MTIGLRIRHPTTGAILIDTSTGMSRIFGSIDVPANNAGSIVVPGFASATPFAISYANSGWNPVLVGGNQNYSTYSISGTTLSWTAGSLSSTIVYGAYAGALAGNSGGNIIGARFRNGNKAIQIDSFYVNHCVLSTGSISIASNSTQTITVNATAPVVAYRGTGLVTVVSQSKSGGTWTIILKTGPLAASGLYYVFDVVQSSSQLINTNFGLRIRNGTTGQITFDSRCKYMRVCEVRDNMADGYPPASQVVSQLAQDNLAAIINPGLWYFDYTRQINDDSHNPVFQTDWYPYFSGAGVNGKLLTEGSVPVGGATNLPPDHPTSLAQTILVDVSNF